MKRIASMMFGSSSISRTRPPMVELLLSPKGLPPFEGLLRTPPRVSKILYVLGSLIPLRNVQDRGLAPRNAIRHCANPAARPDLKPVARRRFADQRHHQH